MSDQWIGPLGAASGGASQSISPDSVTIGVTPSGLNVAQVAYGTFLRPFSADSVWNTPLNSDASYQTSGTHAFQESQTTHAAYLNVSGFFGHPFYEASAGDDTYTITTPSMRTNDGASNVPPGPYTIKCPATATPDTGSDGHLHVLDSDGLTLLDVYGATIDHSAKTIDATIWSHFLQIDSEGLGDPAGSVPYAGGTRAYGGASIAGMVRKWELDAGLIEHRIALMLPGLHLTDATIGELWPATRHDDFGYSNQAHGAYMGECFFIPPTVDISSLGLQPHAETLAQALQTYGGHIVDQSGATSIGLFDIESGDAGYGVSAADAATIADELRRATDVTEINPGG